MDSPWIDIVMPYGTTHGWGICGRALTLAMSRMAKVAYVTDYIPPPGPDSDPDDQLLAGLSAPVERIASLDGNAYRYQFRNPLLQAVEGANLRPWFLKASSHRLIGYAFFEKNCLKKDDVSDASNYFDHIVAGSSWCEEILTAAGIRQCNTILQGVDTKKFHMGLATKEKWLDHFVVFSGGKLELRKGQDLVIRAFKVLQDRHDDVLLVNCWYNRWDQAAATMALSPHIAFDMPKGRYVDAIHHLLEKNGISAHKVITIEPVQHHRMGEVYRNTDCGLFPNRCEGGTNLVLMEYMACGKPVVAANNSGHRDVLSKDHAVLVEKHRPLNIAGAKGELYAQWYDPDLDEVVDKLEWAYQNRDALSHIGRAGSKFISQFTWEKAGREFLSLLCYD